MSYYIIKPLFIIFILYIIFYYINNQIIEGFYVPIVTWRPSYMDIEYQPGWSNYFYNNGYMYPVY